ncbi:MAG: MFS transporter [Oceanospirillales bacterium]|uniref:Sugar phosphate permease n=1 Tax=Marinobacterium halophilum TaxID=267374 RepID=A0A2P8ERF9_9GAMM|nr:MFS transporter [Marinobacterium halophilum]MBR9829020.1 MFS transporter [Oceanospirillales bacterium]PSL12033.1 sugar phosphate permease [Marinobacterium halophilum]
MSIMPPTVTRRSHFTLALLALVYVFSFIDRNVIAIVIEPIKQEFGASDTLMGLLTGLAFAVLYGILGIPLGRMVDQGADRRKMISICCGLWSIATMACGMATSFWQLLIARMTVAVGEAGGMAPSVSMVSDLYPKNRRSSAMSIFMLGPQLGLLIAMVVGGYIAQTYGWRTTFIFFGIPGVLLAATLWFFTRDPGRGVFDSAEERRQAMEARNIKAGPQIKSIFKVRAFVLLCFGVAVTGVVGYGFGIWAPTFLLRTYEMPLAHAGFLFGIASGVFAILGTLFCGWLCDRLIRRNTNWQLALPMLGILISLPMGIAFVLWPQTSSFSVGSFNVPYAMLFCAGFAFFQSWWPTLTFAAVSHLLTSSQRALGAAFVNLFMTLIGAGLGPLLSGTLSDMYSSSMGPDGLRWALATVLCLLLIPALLYGLAIRPYKRRLEELDASLT